MTRVYKPKKKRSRFCCKEVYGDCLEAAGLRIPNCGIAIIHRGARLRVGDLVHCTKISGALSSYIKQVKEIRGDSVIVGTAYTDPSRDFTFEAAEILGVVDSVFDKLYGYRVYVRRGTV